MAIERQVRKIVFCPKLKGGCLVVVILLMAGGAMGQPPRRGQQQPPRTYYVAPTGDDASSGTLAAPFRTIQKGVDAVRPRDTVTIAGGTYKEQVVLHRSGRYLGGTIRIEAAKDEKVVLDNEGLNGPESAVLSTGGQDYVTIAGITVQNGGGRGIAVARSWQVTLEDCRTSNTAASGIIADESGMVKILNCDVAKACQRGGEESVSIKRSQQVEIRDCHIHDTGHEGIDVKEGSKCVRVTGCELDHVERQGLYAEAWDSPTCDIRFENNRVHDCQVGVEAASECGGLLSDVWFVHNLIYNNPGGPGIIVPDWGNTRFAHPVRDIYIIGNTVWKNGNAERDWSGGMVFHNPAAENVVVVNNIFSQNVQGQIRIQKDKTPLSIVVRNNLIEGVTEKIGEDNIEGAAKFVNPEAGDFHLQKGSKAIQAGKPFDMPKDSLAPPAPPTQAETARKVEPGPKRVDLGALPYAP